MSEHLTHIAVFEDCARLVTAAGDAFTGAFAESLRGPTYDVGLLTSASRGNHLVAVPLLEKYRTRWTAGDRGELVQSRIVAALGWLAHRAADLQTKPLGYALEPEWLEGPNPLGLTDREYEIYQDGVAFREVYGGGAYPPPTPYAVLSRATLEPQMDSLPAAAAFVEGRLDEATLRRALT